MITNTSPCVLFVFGIAGVAADITWPLYNQQCQDDAGPPFLDDEPGVKYHDGSGAWPVLLEDGTCADPLKAACASRDDDKTAYLEGELYLCQLQLTSYAFACRVIIYCLHHEPYLTNTNIKCII